MFDIQIKEVSFKQLNDILSALPKQTWICVTPRDTGGTSWKQQGKQVANGSGNLSLTGKSAQQGSMREAVLTTFEKLEKKHGIGNVSRVQLREDCTKKDLDSQIIYQLIRDGYLEERK